MADTWYTTVRHGSHERTFLAAFQRRAVAWMLPRLPAELSPADLTRLSFAGATVASCGLLLCRWRFEFVFLVPLGVLINWFGAALDGPLAYVRLGQHKKTSLAEHLTDLASMFIMIAAYAFSPFLSFEAAVIILACFLLFSAYNNLRSAAGHPATMALIGVSAAEFRLMLACWPFVSRAFNAENAASVTAATAILAAVAVTTLLLKILGDARKIVATRKD